MTVTIDPELIVDDVPPTDEPEFTCRRCGHGLTYNGRGRKPGACSDKNGGDPECYGSSRSTSRTNRGNKSGNEKLARQATDVLVTLNGAGAAGAFMIGWRHTASTIANANDAFEVAAYEALLLDPGLCRLILRGGQNSGKLALGLAYGMFLASVAPAAVSDYRAMAAEKAKAKAETMYGSG